MGSAISPLLIGYDTRAEAAIAASELAAYALRAAILHKGHASIAVSGGSTPGAMFAHLSAAELDWDKVQLGLVDERFVPPDHDASNEKLVRESLLQNAAAAASFLPMWRENVRAEQAAQAVDAAYAAHVPFDFILLGMGPDGHTASWFPGARNLRQALYADAPCVVAIDAKGCKVAGRNTQRLTLSLPAIASGRKAVLLIYGNEKRDVLDEALSKALEACPVRGAIEALGSRLTVIWAE